MRYPLFINYFLSVLLTFFLRLFISFLPLYHPPFFFHASLTYSLFYSYSISLHSTLFSTSFLLLWNSSKQIPKCHQSTNDVIVQNITHNVSSTLRNILSAKTNELIRYSLCKKTMKDKSCMLLRLESCSLVPYTLLFWNIQSAHMWYNHAQLSICHQSRYSSLEGLTSY